MKGPEGLLSAEAHFVATVDTNPGRDGTVFVRKLVRPAIPTVC